MSVRKDYRTCDLYLAAYLKAIKVPFEGSLKLGGKFYFIFAYDSKVKEYKSQFFNREGSVSALTYADELRALKSLCHSG